MATLTERLELDYQQALKAGQRRRVDTIRLIKAAIQRLAMDKRKERLEDREVLDVLAQQVKQRRETLEAATKGNRQDILAQTNEELVILKAYLPEPLTEAALKQLVEEAVQAVGPDRGQVMKYVMGKAAGAADGKLVNQLVGERLKGS